MTLISHLTVFRSCFSLKKWDQIKHKLVLNVFFLIITTFSHYLNCFMSQAGTLWHWSVGKITQWENSEWCFLLMTTSKKKKKDAETNLQQRVNGKKTCHKKINTSLTAECFLKRVCCSHFFVTASNLVHKKVTLTPFSSSPFPTSRLKNTRTLLQVIFICNVFLMLKSRCFI